MTTGRYTLDPGIKVFISDLRMSWLRVLRRASLPGDLLSRGPARLTTEEYFRFWSALEQEAGDRDLALDVGRAISVETFSPPIMAALCSPDLAVAAHRIATYKPLVGPLRLDVAETVDGLRIGYQWPPGQPPPALLATSELRPAPRVRQLLPGAQLPGSPPQDHGRGTGPRPLLGRDRPADRGREHGRLRGQRRRDPGRARG